MDKTGCSVLGFDTAFGRITSIGIYFSDNLKTEYVVDNSASQEEKLLAKIDEKLKSLNKNIADIDIIGVGIGPGSFTGIRIGVATARALAWSGKKEITGISSLELLARSVDSLEGDIIVPVSDARMKRVYASVFENGNRISKDTDISPEDLVSELQELKGKRLVLAGDGVTRYKSVFGKAKFKYFDEVVFLENATVSGLVICSLALSGEGISGLDKVFPSYLRKFNQ
jgi:tRNA threonylcarbamoyladenosine biosynthesis protein TsaB